MYAPPGFDSDSSGEETTPPPTPAPPPPPKPQFKFRSLFTLTKKLKARAPRQAEGLKKDEEKEPPAPMKKRVIFASELLGGQKGSKVEGLTTTTGEKIEPELPSLEESKQGIKLEPAGLTEQTAINPVASEMLVLLRQLVAECHATNKNTDPEPKADSISRAMNEGSSANNAESEKKIDLPGPEAIIATDRKFDRPIDTEPAQETRAPQHRPSHLLPSILGRQQCHLADNYFANFGGPFANKAPPSSTSVNKLCHLRPPHTAPPYGYYPQLASPYLWTAYHSRLQWWPFDHHSTSDEKKTVTKLSPPHFTLFDPVISESSRLPLEPHVRKYEAAYNRALEDYKEPGLEQEERKRLKEKVRSHERRLNEARQALEDTEWEAGIGDDSGDPSPSESKGVRESQDEPSKETNSSPETQYAGYQGENDTTPAADNPTKPKSAVIDESRALEMVKKKKVKALMSEDEAGEQARKAKDVSKEGKCSAMKPFGDMKEVEATASILQRKGGPHLKTSPPLPSIIEARGVPVATAHDRQLHNKEAEKLKSKVISLRDENESSQAGVGEGKKGTIKGDGDPPVKKLKEYNNQVEVVDIETLLELAKVKYSKLAKAAKEETIGDETRRKRKAKVEKQALIVQAMMKAMDKRNNECKRQAVVDKTEKNPKTGKDEMGSKEKAQILSRGMILEEVEQAIGQVKEEQQTEKINNSTTEEKESRQCPPSGCELATSCKKWASLYVTKSKAPVNNPIRPRPANAIRHPSVPPDVRRWLDEEGPEALTWSKTLVSLAKCVGEL